MNDTAELTAKVRTETLEVAAVIAETVDEWADPYGDLDEHQIAARLRALAVPVAAVDLPLSDWNVTLPPMPTFTGPTLVHIDDVAPNQSPTDAFEDAEVAREEAKDEREALSKLLYLAKVSDFAGSNANEIGHLCDLAADAILAAGFSRQPPATPTDRQFFSGVGDESPASTTAADAWFEGARRVIDHNKAYPLVMPTDCPYRVAAPEGDGGNE